MTYFINRKKSSTKISNKILHLTIGSIALHIVSRSIPKIFTILPFIPNFRISKKFVFPNQCWSTIPKNMTSDCCKYGV